MVALSALDLLAGNVTPGWLAGHLPVVAGLALLLLHARLGRDGRGTTATGRDEARGGDGHGDDGHGDAGLGGRFGDGGLQPSAHHRAA